MLPDLTLDNQNYEDILEEAINMVTSIFPEWTDFNEHDPGITLLELFAVLKESQQFFMDQIGENNRKKFLKLLGLQRRAKQKAHTLVQLKGGENGSLLLSHKMMAGDICFENQKRKQLIAKDVAACLCICDGQMQNFITEAQLEFGELLRFYPFGEKENPPAQCYFYFQEKLSTRIALDLYIEVYKNDSVSRNPVGNFDFLPLVELKWEYFSSEGWKELSDVEDETRGFLFDGFLQFSLETEMEKTSVEDLEGYFLRVNFQKGEYDIPPMITRISANVCEVEQKDTLVESVYFDTVSTELFLDTELCVCGSSEVYLKKKGIFYPAAVFTKEFCEEEGTVRFQIEDEDILDAQGILILNRAFRLLHKKTIGMGNGFPYQEIDLEDLQLCKEEFSILVQDIEEEDGFRLWQQVEDFSKSTPEDRHFVLDSRRGILLFGDCIHGMAPEGKIVLAGYVRTLGADGNIKKGKINHFSMEELQSIELNNICEGTGGLDEESMEECFQRARKYIGEVGCAVTKTDYENFVLKTPGMMIESCQVLDIDGVKRFMKNVDETAVYIVVKPYGWKKERKGLKRYQENITRYLRQYRMLGSQVIVDFPEYAQIDVYVELVIKPQYFDVEQLIQEAIEDFFAQYKDAFGATITFQSLYGHLDIQDFVVKICSLNMDVRSGNVRRTVEGDICLPANGLALLFGVKTSLVIS